MFVQYSPFFDTSQIPFQNYFECLSEDNLHKDFSKYEICVARKTETISEKFLRSFKTYLDFSENQSRKHRSILDAFYLSSKEHFDIGQFTRSKAKKNRFTSKDLFDAYQKNNLMEVIECNSLEQKTTKAFRFTEYTKENFARFVDEWNFAEEKKLSINLDANAIADETREGIKRTTNIQLPKYLNLTKTNPFYDEFLKLTKEEFMKTGLSEDDWSTVQKIRANAICQDNHLKQEYEPSIYGRLYGKGVSENLQLIKNRLLPFIIPHSWDYDITASCYTIISQLAKKYQSDLKIDAVENYVNNRKEIRKNVAKDLEVSEEQIKKCFTIVGHGAKEIRHSWMNQKGLEESGSIIQELGIQKGNEFFDHPNLTDLFSQIKKCGQIIVNNYSYPDYFLKNRKTKSFSQKLSFAVFHEEVSILDKCVSIFSDSPEKIYALKHDGFITSERIQTDWLKDYIKKQTGYSINFEEERISDYPVKNMNARTTQPNQI